MARAEIADRICSLARRSEEYCLAFAITALFPRLIFSSVKSSSIAPPRTILASLGFLSAEISSTRVKLFSSFAFESSCGLSHLLMTAIFAAPDSSSAKIISSSSRENSRLPSKSAIISSALFIASRERSMPKSSILSSLVSRIPAVSERRSRVFPSEISAERTSRVVPGVSVTIARSSPSIRL